MDGYGCTGQPCSRPRADGARRGRPPVTASKRARILVGLGQGERQQVSSRRDYDELLSIRRERHGGRADCAAGLYGPEGRARAGVEREEGGLVAAEHDAAPRGENPAHSHPPEPIVAQSRLAPILPYPSSSGGVQGTDRCIERSAADCRWRTRREEDHALL